MVFFVFKLASIQAKICLIVTLLLISTAYAEEDEPVMTFTLYNDDITLVIPKTHLAPVYSKYKQGVWVYLSYPDFEPLEITKPELEGLIAAGEVIDFSLSKVPVNKDKANALNIEIKKNKADLKAGEEFGLSVFKQSDAAQAHRPNIWVDNETAPSFIVCQDGEDLKTSTCSHYLYIDNFYIIVFYHKSELENWQNIKTKVVELYQSYKNAESE